MKKLILPVLFAVFTLFFSGKSVSSKNCGPFIHLDYTYETDAVNITVTSVVIQNTTTGNTTTYNNPTFPFDHNEQGGNILITFNYTQCPYCGMIVGSSSYCQADNFTNTTSHTMSLPGFNCDTYYVPLLSNDKNSRNICP